jgi:hypothetical protein
MKPAVMPPVDEGELHLLTVHAGVGLRVRYPDRCVVRRCFLTRLLQQIIDALLTNNRIKYNSLCLL